MNKECKEKVLEVVKNAVKDRVLIKSNEDAQKVAAENAFKFCTEQSHEIVNNSNSVSCFYKLPKADTFWDHVKACEINGAVLAYPETIAELSVFENRSNSKVDRIWTAVGFVNYFGCYYMSVDGKFVLTPKDPLWGQYFLEQQVTHPIHCPDRQVVNFATGSDQNMGMAPSKPKALTHAFCKVSI